MHDRATSTLLSAERRQAILSALARDGKVLAARLVDELGVEPGHELRRLEQRVIEQARSPDWTPPAGSRAGQPTGRPATGVVTFLLTDIEGSTRD